MFGGLLLSKTHHRAAKRHESNKRQQKAAKRSKEKQKGNQEHPTCQRKVPKCNALPVLARKVYSIATEGVWGREGAGSAGATEAGG